MGVLKYNLNGQRFGSLSALFRVENTAFGEPQWLCKCDCGKEVKVSSGSLRRGNTRSCGCLLTNFNKTKVKDLIGQKFFRLLVLSRVASRNRVNSPTRARWECLCDCGNKIEANTSSLVSGSIKSCGCLIVDLRQERAESPELARAYPGVYTLFHIYKKGAERRQLSFSLSIEELKELSSQKCAYCGSEPSKHIKRKHNILHTYNGIDRIDNSLGYEPGNCLPCCTICNKAKSSLSYSEFITWLDTVTSFRANQVIDNKEFT